MPIPVTGVIRTRAVTPKAVGTDVLGVRGPVLRSRPKEIVRVHPTVPVQTVPSRRTCAIGVNLTMPVMRLDLIRDALQVSIVIPINDVDEVNRKRLGLGGFRSLLAF
jgi:hypothetical protein